jgi:putative acetyltransferase
MKARRRYPTAVDPTRVGRYPALANSGGGYVWDEVLEYRVWCHPERGAPDLHEGDDYFFAFATYPKALAFSRRTRGAEEPLALVRQRQYIDEPSPGKYIHVKKVRVTEWRVEWLHRPRRNRHTIADFLSPRAPANRLDIIRGRAKPTRSSTKAKKKRVVN